MGHACCTVEMFFVSCTDSQLCDEHAMTFDRCRLASGSCKTSLVPRLSLMYLVQTKTYIWRYFINSKDAESLSLVTIPMFLVQIIIVLLGQCFKFGWAIFDKFSKAWRLLGQHTRPQGLFDILHFVGLFNSILFSPSIHSFGQLKLFKLTNMQRSCILPKT